MKLSALFVAVVLVSTAVAVSGHRVLTTGAPEDAFWKCIDAKKDCYGECYQAGAADTNQFAEYKKALTVFNGGGGFDNFNLRTWYVDLDYIKKHSAADCVLTKEGYEACAFEPPACVLKAECLNGKSGFKFWDVMENKEDISYFAQFDKAVTAKHPAVIKTRMTVALQKKDLKKRWADLNKLLTFVNSQSVAGKDLEPVVWGKIESPYYLRVDTLLLQLATPANPKAKTLSEALKSHIVSVEKVGNALSKFITAQNIEVDLTRLPPYQKVIGKVSIADYTKGSSFGTDLCEMVQKHKTRQAFEAAYNKDVLVNSVYPVFDHTGIAEAVQEASVEHKKCQVLVQTHTSKQNEYKQAFKDKGKSLQDLFKLMKALKTWEAEHWKDECCALVNHPLCRFTQEDRKRAGH